MKRVKIKDFKYSNFWLEDLKKFERRYKLAGWTEEALKQSFPFAYKEPTRLTGGSELEWALFCLINVCVDYETMISGSEFTDYRPASYTFAKVPPATKAALKEVVDKYNALPTTTNEVKIELPAPKAERPKKVKPGVELAEAVSNYQKNQSGKPIVL